MKFHHWAGFVFSLFVAVVSTGCSSNSAKAQAKRALKPAELVTFTPSVSVKRLWSANVGKGEGRIGIGQRPAVADGRVYAAAVSGGVLALDLSTGRKVWRYQPTRERGKPHLRLSGGPGAGEGLVVIGSLEGQVIALNAANGQEKWKTRVSGEVIAAPAIAQGFVFVRSNDGRVTALDARNGQQRWVYNRELPSLTVRGNAPVVTGPGVLFIGNDDGTLSAVALDNGQPLWEQVVASPEGRTELERMADVDAAPIVDGNTVYATSFKQQTIAIEGPTGRPLWAHDHGSAGGLAVSSGHVVMADVQGTVYGLDKITGRSVWSQQALARRSLSGVAIHGDYAVVGDYKGYVHWLRLRDGAFAARARSRGGEALLAQPVVSGNIMLVQNVTGQISAFQFAQ